MPRFRLSLIAAVVIGLCADHVAAQEIGPDDRAAIAARIDALGQVMSAGDMAGALDVIPPRLLQATAARFGATEEQLRQAFAEAAAGMMAGVAIVSYDMDLDAATTHLTPDGARTYLLVPTETVMEVDGAGRVRAFSQTLAMEEGGQWYLVRVVDPAQRAMLGEVYPEFVGVDFPAGAMTTAD